MPLGDVRVMPTLKAYTPAASLFDLPPAPEKPKRTAPFDQEPGYHAPAGLWLYGNVRLLEANLAYIPESLGPPTHGSKQLDALGRIAEDLILSSKVLVCGVHNRVSPKSCCYATTLGSTPDRDLLGRVSVPSGTRAEDGPFRAGRLWRYEWDPKTDLAISRLDPDKLPTFATTNWTVDKMIERIASCSWSGLRLLEGESPHVLV